MPRTKKEPAQAGRAQPVPTVPKPASDPERVMVLMALVSQGAQADEVRQACEELAISPALVKQTIDGLEQNARVLRAVFEMLADNLGDDEEDD